MAERLESTESLTHPLGGAGDTTTSSIDDPAGPPGETSIAMSGPPHHAYRLPELADAMRQTVSYGGCAVSPTVSSYQRMDQDIGDASAPRKTSTIPSRGVGVEERLSHSSVASSSRIFSGNDAFNSKTGRPHTLVLRFDIHGTGTFQQMSRLDVLHTTREAAKPKPPPPESDDGTEPGSDDATEAQVTFGGGDTSTSSRSRVARRGSRRFSSVGGLDTSTGATSAMAKGGDVRPVNARDIRKLDHAFAVSNEPSIVVRKQAVLMNADPLRAVIMRDACLVFVPDGADSLLATLKTNFRQHALQLYLSEAGAHGELPYEMRALEALLATLCRHFEYDFEKTVPVVASTLDRLAHGRTISTGDLETLRGFKNTINEFESQVDGVRRALMELLDNEEDLRLLHLTKLYNEPHLLGDLYSFDSEDVEVLVENYLQDIFSTRTKASLMQSRIQNTESLVMLKLDSMRNYLLGVDLIFSLVAISISVGTYVTGAFGMNLDSHLQTTQGMFWGVVIFTVVAFLLIMATGVVFFRQKGVLL